MKQTLRFLVLCTALLALVLTGCSSGLVVKPGAITRVDDMLVGLAGGGTFTGSVLIAQDGKVLLGGPGLVTLIIRYPEDKLTEIVLANQGDINHGVHLGGHLQ
jgi:hypothetical protein